MRTEQDLERKKSNKEPLIGSESCKVRVVHKVTATDNRVERWQMPTLRVACFIIISVYCFAFNLFIHLFETCEQFTTSNKIYNSHNIYF